MTRDDEFARLRLSVGAAAAAAQSASAPEPGAEPRRACRTVKIQTYPSSSPAFFGLQEYEILGAEGEGNPGVENPVGDPFLGLCLAAVVPDEGTKVEATFVPFRWVFIP